jgi:hypothetical protein
MRRVGRRTTGSAPSEPSPYGKAAIERYLAGPRVPFSEGYTEYKEQCLEQIWSDSDTTRIFATGAQLPLNFGSRLDERIVEYPWVLSRLAEGDGLVVDAGGTFNKPVMLAAPQLRNRRILVYTLETDWITYEPRLSYVFGDLRNMLLRDGCAQTLVCISTLEHVGFTYEYATYSRRNPWPHATPASYLEAIDEFRRVLAPGGRMLLTIPFGQHEDHGWLQQFDAAMIESIKARFGGSVRAEVYYRYCNGGWTVTSPAACAALSYFNIHETGRFDEDGLAAARAVACLDLERAP